MTVIVDVQIAYDGQCPKIEQFQQWAEAALQSVTEDCELSIRVVHERESAELNSTYRDKTGPTNVLSFPFDSPVPMDPRLLGDLIICGPAVEKEAQEQQKVINHHWAHLVVHGCLHLLGYDHIEDDEAEVMEALEVKILQSLAISDPYQDQGDNK
ncbi:MAG: rRNA maturation RNase YbeY [Gammaproteobacteria bacterium]|nr:rRNA maturation RNase YbeY [Gammaproteobacteria bacterium]